MLKHNGSQEAQIKDKVKEVTMANLAGLGNWKRVVWGDWGKKL